MKEVLNKSIEDNAQRAIANRSPIMGIEHNEAPEKHEAYVNWFG